VSGHIASRPDTHRLFPFPIRHLLFPFAIGNSLFAVLFRSALAARRSPSFPIRHSQFAIRYSPFFYSPFAYFHDSLLATRCSPLAVFSIRHSLFAVFLFAVSLRSRVSIFASLSSTECRGL
jgi:hypothetical protein